MTGSLSVGGTTDNSSFTAGTSTGTPAMGFYHSTIDTVTDGRSAAVAITAKRGQHANLRDSSGNEIGTSTSPVGVGGIDQAGSMHNIRTDSRGNINIGSATYSMQSEFEATTGWTANAQAINLATTTTHVGPGSNFLTFDKTTGGTLALISKTITSIDLSSFSLHATGLGSMYLSSLSNIVSVNCRIGTDSSNYTQYDFPVANLVVGWNNLEAFLVNPSSQTGAGYSLASITYIAFGVTTSGAGNTVTGIITGGWQLKRNLGTFNGYSSTTSANIGPTTMIKDGTGNTRLDVKAGSTYNYAVTGLTDGTDLALITTAGEQLVSGSGTAGTAATGVLTIQGIASMTPVQISQATASNLNATIVGTKTNNNAAPSTDNLGVLPALANASSPTFSEGNLALLSVDTAGNLRATVNKLGGNAINTGNGTTGTGTQRVTIASDSTGTLAVTNTGTFAVQNTPVAPTTIFDGKTTVTTAGTRVALASSQAVKSVTIKALYTNTGTIYVGNSSVSSTNGFQLGAGESVSMDISNLNTVNIDASVNGEGVTYIGVN